MYEYEGKSHRVRNVFIVIFLMIMVSIGSILIYKIYFDDNVVAQIDGVNHTETQEKDEEKEKSTTEILEETNKSVVGISKIKNVGSSIFLSNSTKELGLGTGIIISENGYILTNWHVSGDKYSNCYITLENSKSYNGSVVWADSDLDLAIIKINAINLPYAKLGDSNNIKIGQQVYAIGNPVGVEFQRTVTFGIISGLDRTVKVDENGKTTYMEDLIQTDATINEGNSGGPLIDENGNVVGINSVKITSADGIGFAIPINIIKPVLEKFSTNDKFDEAYLGVFAYDKGVIPYLYSSIDFSSGIYVAEISKDGPAYNTGLKVGDIITKIDEVVINKMSELRNYIYTKLPTEEVNLTVLRNKKEYSLNIKLGKK